MKRCLRLVYIVLLAGLPLWAQESSQPADASSAAGSTQTVGERVPNASGFEVLSRGTPQELKNYPFRVLAGVRNRWYPQLAELKKSANWKRGTTVIEFAINRDGSLGEMRTVESAGEASLRPRRSRRPLRFPSCRTPTLDRHSGFVIISAMTSPSVRKLPCVRVPTSVRTRPMLPCIRWVTGSRLHIPSALPTLSIQRWPAR